MGPDHSAQRISRVTPAGSLGNRTRSGGPSSRDSTRRSLPAGSRAAAELPTTVRGKIVPFRNAPAIAVAVVALLQDEPLRHSMRKNAYKLRRDMAWSRVV